MEKYIEAIIEIVLEYVTCLHQLLDEHPRGPKFDDVTYGIDNEQELMKKCLKLKPERKVAEDWIAGEAYWPKTKNLDREGMIEKGARAIHDEAFGSLSKCGYQCNIMGRFRIQIRKVLGVK